MYVPGSPSDLRTGNGTEGAMFCTSLGNLLRPLFYFLFSNLKANPVHGTIFIDLVVNLRTHKQKPFKWVRACPRKACQTPSYSLTCFGKCLMRIRVTVVAFSAPSSSLSLSEADEDVPLPTF